MNSLIQSSSPSSETLVAEGTLRFLTFGDFPKSSETADDFSKVPILEKLGQSLKTWTAENPNTLLAKTISQDPSDKIVAIKAINLFRELPNASKVGLLDHKILNDSISSSFLSAPLFKACQEGNLPFLKNIFESPFFNPWEEFFEGSFFSFNKTPWAKTILCILAEHGHLEALKWFLGLPIISNSQTDPFGRHPLFYTAFWALISATEAGHVDIMEFLIEDFFSDYLNTLDLAVITGTLLPAAVQSGRCEVVDFLLSTPISFTKEELEAALKWAQQENRKDIIKALKTELGQSCCTIQ